jgi:thiol-disulfide isomerase/thioredoxin
MRDIRWQKYFIAFGITVTIFLTAFYINARLNDARIANIRATEDSISIDLLSSETQFELLGSFDCTALEENPVLSDALNSLAERLSYAESNLGSDNSDVVLLKKQYSLLEIRDYLLMQQISQKCHTKPISIIYFYSNTGDCPDCAQAGNVLTYLRQEYPGLRVYSFDYHLDLSALQTLLSLRKVKPELPAFIINGKAPVYGFKDLAAMQALIPELKTLATSSATSTKQ